MAQPEITSSQNLHLSTPARLLFCFGAPSTILLASLVSPKTGLLVPFSLLPTIYLYRKWASSNRTAPSRRGERELMLWTYATTGTLGLPLVAMGQLVVCVSAAYLIFPAKEARDFFWKEVQRTTIEGLTVSQLAARAVLARSWQNSVLNFAFSFGAAGLCEELLKYLPIGFARRRGPPEKRKQRDRAYLDYALAASLSFSVVEGVGQIYSFVTSENQTLGMFAMTLLERFVIGQIGHATVAALTAFRAIRRDYYGDAMGLWRVIGPSAFLHGLADFVCLSASAMEGNVGWIHPDPKGWIFGSMFTVYVGVFGTAAWLARREWREIERRDAEESKAGLVKSTDVK